MAVVALGVPLFERFTLHTTALDLGISSVAAFVLHIAS